MSIIDMRKGYEPVTILLYDRKKKHLSEEISLVALDKASSNIVAIGNEAKSLIHDKNSNIVIISPIKNGAIADYILAEKMLHYMLKRVSSKMPFLKPSVAISVSVDITEVERKALEDAVYQSGAKTVFFSEKTVEELDRTLPTKYGIILSLVPDDKEEQIQKESWLEACKGEIPVDYYQILSVNSQESGKIITLLGRLNCVEIKFQNVLMVRMMVKEVISEELFAENAFKRYRNDNFRNVIYQIDGGQLNNWLSSRGKAYQINSSHYLIITEAEVLEIIAQEEPVITIIK